MTHHLVRRIPDDLLTRDGNDQQRLRRAAHLTQWLDVRGIRGVTAYDLDAERRRRLTQGKDNSRV